MERRALLLFLFALIAVGAWTLLQAPDPSSGDRGSAAVGEVDAGSSRDDGSAKGVGTAENDPKSSDVEAAGEDESRRTVAGVAVAGVRARMFQGGEAQGGLQIEVWSRYQLVDQKKVATVTTAADGRLLVTGMHAGRHTLVPIGPRVPKGWFRRHVQVKKGQELDLGEVHIPKAGSIRGKVVDEKGVAMPGVLVFHLFRMGYSSASFARDKPADAEGADPSMRTDDQGGFRFDRLAPGEHFVLAESKEHADTESEVKLAEGVDHDLGTMVLKIGRELRGRVEDRFGEPIRGARVAPDAHFMSAPSLRRASRTDALGEFHLFGLGRFTRKLEVVADGYQPAGVQLSYSKNAPLVIVLKKAIELNGEVKGTKGRKTTIRLENEGPSVPMHVFRVLMEELPVASDGTFKVEGLVPGKYSAVATTKGIGKSLKTNFEFSAKSKPLVLSILELAQLTVHVVDDTGAAVANARVVRDPSAQEYPSLYKDGDPALADRIIKSFRARKLTHPVTDALGAAKLGYPTDEILAIAVANENHLARSRVFPAGAVPDEVRLVLPRAASIKGLVTAARGPRKFSISVQLMPLPKRTKTRDVVSLTVDATGRFGRTGIPPGQYEIGISYYDMTWQDKTDRTMKSVTPIVGANLDQRTARTVELIAGETTDVTLETRPFGSISGKVLSVDGPVKGAIVFAVKAGAKADDNGFLSKRPFDSPDGHSFRPHMKTGKDGGYRFLYANPGAWDLRVRHPKSAATMRPVRVQASRHGEHIERDLSLGGAIVKGQLDTSKLSAKEKKLCSAYLFRIGEADADPFYSGHHSLPQTSHTKEVELDSEGRFAFEFMPAGDWVLRITVRLSMAIQRRVQTALNQRVDLGVLRPRTTFPVTLTCKLPPLPKPKAGERRRRLTHGVWIREVIAGRERGIFLKTKAVRSGKVKLPLPVGQYEVELFRAHSGLMGMGFSGTTTQQTAKLEVRNDGTAHPTDLDFTTPK